MLLLAKVKLSVTSIQGKILKALLELEANIYWLIDVLCRFFSFFLSLSILETVQLQGTFFGKKMTLIK